MKCYSQMSSFVSCQSCQKNCFFLLARALRCDINNDRYRVTEVQCGCSLDAAVECNLVMFDTIFVLLQCLKPVIAELNHCRCLISS